MPDYDQWDYLFVQVCPARTFTTTSWRAFAVNDEPLPNWERGMEWQEYFQQLGNQGWELVTFEEHFLTNPVLGGKLAIFKRRRPRELKLKRLATDETSQTPPPIRR